MLLKKMGLANAHCRVSLLAITTVDIELDFFVIQQPEQKLRRCVLCSLKH
jgi:hypothetical protein